MQTNKIKNMKHIITSLLAIITFCQIAIAQNENPIKSGRGISIGYFGVPKIKNGIQIEYEKYPLETDKYKVINRYSFLFISRQHNFKSFAVFASSGLRRTYKSGLFLEYNIKGGLGGTYYPFDVFEANKDGEVINVGKKIRPTFYFGNSFGGGYDFSKKTKLDLQFFIKPFIYYSVPNFDHGFFYVNNVAIECGITFHPSFRK